MLSSFILILIVGFVFGEIARRLKAPPLIGMILAGILLGKEMGNIISPEILENGDSLRKIAVMIILMKAGLGLDKDKLAQQGKVAIKLGIFPAMCEAIAISFLAIFFFDFDWITGLLLGCIIGAESPAVIVPGMLKLKSLGWGVKKGIPDAILTGSALSDVFLLLIFSLLLNFLSQGSGQNSLSLNSILMLPFQVLMQVGLGVILGYIVAYSLVFLLTKKQLTSNTVQDVLITALIALSLVITAEKYPYFSGYLGVMALGFFLIELDAPLARRLRNGFDGLWIVAEIVLFVLMGATIQISIIENNLISGSLLLILGLLLGRSLGWYLSTLGSNWHWKEKLFLLPGNSAKATVQAAIGAIPLSMGIEGGEIILAVSALSILITAPLGAWAIPTFAPKLLKKGIVDPTKISVNKTPLLLGVIDDSPLTLAVLKTVADIARRSNAEVIILHIININESSTVELLKKQSQKILADINYRFITVTGSIPESILKVAQELNVNEIIMGKRGQQPWQKVLIGSVSQFVIENSIIPVILVEDKPI
jgi:NhaP-type Na+/H+ or K+/H+ antiporter/nucleotide-binding universal stress UspA family protein